MMTVCNIMQTQRVGRLAAWGGVIAAFALLTACATSPEEKKPSAPASPSTAARIDQEMTTAAASFGAASAERVQSSLLPPLKVDLPPAAAEAVEPRFDLVVSNAPAGQVFMALVANTPYSMLVSPDVSGQISVSLKNVTVKEALESIRDIYGYEFTINGKRIQVQSNAAQTRIFQVNYLAGKRLGASELRVVAGSITTQTSSTGGSSAAGGGSTSTTKTSDTSRVSTSTEADFWGDLRAALVAIVGEGEGRGVILNTMSGVILVKAGAAELRAVENYLRRTQLIIERQVMLEAKIIDVSLSDEYLSGVNWAAFGTRGRTNIAGGAVASGVSLPTNGSAITSSSVNINPGTAGSIAASAAGNGFLGLSLQTDNFSSLISFLETQGKVQVLSSPRIATLNNQKAVLKVGADEFYVTNVKTETSTGAAGTTTSPTISLSPFFSGISLDVTPQIDADNNIILHVHPAVSVVSEKQKQIDLGALGSFVLPLAASTINETDSIVRVENGRIVAIGGLMKQEDSKGRSQVPGLGDTPVVGGLFGRRESTLRKRELVILIKPTIIEGNQQWADDVVATQQRIRDLTGRNGSGAKGKDGAEEKPAAY